jgi:predicted metalloprotease with PDZ domain
MPRLIRSLAVAAFGVPAFVGAQQQRDVSAPISDIQYEITVDSAAVGARELAVTMSFRVSGTQPVVLALPAWSPGHYVLIWFASRVSHFSAESNGQPLEWRKVDFQTWTIAPRGAGTVKVSFHYLADVVDRAIAWTAPNFAFFNGTNLFLYPVGRGFDWTAHVVVHTEPGWRVTTGMAPGGAPNTFTESNYHDLVDMPFYVGRFDLDSTRAADRWVRLALYPAGAMTPERRDRWLGWLQKILPAHASVFGDVPFRNYTVFLRSDTVVNGGGLEHQSSQVDEVLTSQLDANLVGLFSHEMFHAWNVKRLRPADLVPYRYDDAQPTGWLWVSEGVTDYYGSLALSRTAIADSTTAFSVVGATIAVVGDMTSAAVADASLSAWIPMTDGSAGLYYPKGDVLGLLLDIAIRNGSGNRHSLDDVMRQLYDSTYKKGKGFTSNDWWTAVARNASNGENVAAATTKFLEFSRRYVEGREPLPIDSVLALAGLKVDRVSIREPRLGITTRSDSSGIAVASVTAGGPAAAAGLLAGDRIISIGDVTIKNDASFAEFRSHYAGTSQVLLPLVLRRGAETMTFHVPVVLIGRSETRVVPLPNASPAAVAIRHSIFFAPR